MASYADRFLLVMYSFQGDYLKPIKPFNRAQFLSSWECIRITHLFLSSVEKKQNTHQTDCHKFILVQQVCAKIATSINISTYHVQFVIYYPILQQNRKFCTTILTRMLENYTLKSPKFLLQPFCRFSFFCPHDVSNKSLISYWCGTNSDEKSYHLSIC